MPQVASSSRMAASSGRSAKLSAASSTLGRMWMSPTVLRKTPGRPSTQLTAVSIAPWSVSGSYQVAAVWSLSPQGARVIDLIVYMATLRSAQTSASASKSARYCPFSDIG